MISVLLPYRDAAPTLPRAIESVLAEQACGELLAINDGSSDSSLALVRSLAKSDPRIRMVESDARGVAAALAQGLSLARGELIGRMDADDISLPGRLTRASAQLTSSSPEVAVVGTQVRSEGGGPGLERYVAWQNQLISPEDHARELFVEAPLCHPSVVMRRAALEDVGGYREMPWPQDYDLWLRFDAHGYRMAKVPEVLLAWCHSEGRVTFTSPRCSLDRLADARAHYLEKKLRRAGPFVVWGAGRTARRLARALGALGCEPEAFYDIDPRKIGRTLRAKPIQSAEGCLAEERFVLVAVGARGAREIVRSRLLAAGKQDPHDFVCVA